MNERIKELAMQAFIADSVERNPRYKISENTNIIMKDLAGFNKKFAELILANADELKRGMNTDPINKPFELNPKFVAKCDEIGRSRRQFQ